MSYTQEFTNNLIPEVRQMIWEGDIGYRAFRFDLSVLLQDLYNKGHDYSLELESVCWEYMYRMTSMMLQIDKNPSLTDEDKEQAVMLTATWIEQEVYKEANHIQFASSNTGLSIIPERVRH